jgi:hypothetical protein
MTNAYLGALMVRYWPLIPKYYAMSSNVAEPEDVYGWLVDSIMYALKHRRWNDEDSNIYQDKNGPDKVINRRMKCARLTFYQFINRKKRKEDFGTLSLDQLQEDLNDNIDFEEDSLNIMNTGELDLKDYIVDQFRVKDYFLAFLLDIVINDNIFEFDVESQMSVLNKKKLVKRLKAIDQKYCLRFAETYKLDSDYVLNSLKYFNPKSTNYLNRKIETYFQQLRHDRYFKEMILHAH